MATGPLTASSLTAAYLQRIAALDSAGPRIGAVCDLHPGLIEIAEALDHERVTSGPRGPLHGIPVLIKDNIACTAGRGTTGGSTALAGVRPVRNAAIVDRLEAAGAIVLGSANLSEWANIRSSRSTSGWSAQGGLTRNPYALDRSTSGSSSGSAAAVAADFCVVAVGTETDGSIVSPASINGLVGIKPTVGLVSRDGIIPISHTQDTAGPMARCVADAAALLTVLAGPDPRDGATAQAPVLDYTEFLDRTRLDAVRLGVVRSHLSGNPAVDACFDAQLRVLEALGADLHDMEMKPTDTLGEAELTVLLHELKHGLARWLAEFAPHAPISSLADLIAWNRDHAAVEMRWFGQELFELAEACGGLEAPEYLAALDACRTASRTEGLDALFDGLGLEAVIAPTGGPAWLIDLVNGDNYTGSFSTPAAMAGYPHVTVPMGDVMGLPVGLSFVGRPWSEPALIGFASAFEQATQARRPPTFASSLPDLTSAAR
jgi:amidase